MSSMICMCVCMTLSFIKIACTSELTYVIKHLLTPTITTHTIYSYPYTYSYSYILTLLIPISIPTPLLEDGYPPGDRNLSLAIPRTGLGGRDGGLGASHTAPQLRAYTVEFAHPHFLDGLNIVRM
ncbi:hypothetical protein EON63_01120 [archaeon]|nr:MAG: hypothetical protein EON63_01120 [archaeon]